MRRRKFAEFGAAFEILRRLNFTERNFDGMKFSSAKFNDTAMEFYRDAGLGAVAKFRIKAKF